MYILSTLVRPNPVIVNSSDEISSLVDRQIVSTEFESDAGSFNLIIAMSLWRVDLLYSG